jgi:disulfide bond formation protein DsbB
MKMTVSLERTLNIVALLGVLLVLSGSLILQFGEGEQPCPLCLVQRSGMIGLAIGPAMNLLWGLRPRYYAISILAALVGGAGSVRQILLHIATPGDPGFGPAVLGFHLYTWAAITFIAAIGLIAVIMLFDRPLLEHDKGLMRASGPSLQRLIAFAVIAWTAIYAVIITIAIIPECGIGMCPDDPVDNAGLGLPLTLGLMALIVVISVVIGARANRIVRR